MCTPAEKKKNWRYGLPVIKELIQKGDDAKAEETVIQTVKSYINSYRKVAWNLENTLLINVLAYGYGEPDDELCEVLEKWLSIAKRSQQNKKYSAIKFQLSAYRSPHDWQQIATVYHEVSLLTGKDLAGELFNQWKYYVVTHTFGLSFGDQDSRQDCWLGWQ